VATGSLATSEFLMDPLHLVVLIIATIALTGIAVAIDAILAWHLGYPRRRPLIGFVLSILVPSSGFVAIVLLGLHWAVPSTLSKPDRRSSPPAASRSAGP
jgi:hypothetical protein